MTTKTQATESVTSIVNNNLQDALATIISKTVAGVDAASNFLGEQLPDVIHQLLMWKMVWAGFSFVICCAVIAVLYFGMRKLYAVIEAEDGDHFATFMAGVIAVITGVVFFFVALSELQTFLQIWIAPKVWLIEYTASLVKG